MKQEKISTNKKYDLRKIRRSYDYTTKEITELFSISRRTVTRWIKSDSQLVINPDSKPFYISGENLWTFLSNRFNTFDYSYKSDTCNWPCPHCNRHVTTVIGSEKTKDKQNQLFGVCSLCNNNISTFIKRIEFADPNKFKGRNIDHNQRTLFIKEGDKM